MSFFSHKKSSSTGDKKPSPKRDLIPMTCPDCQHEQPESKIAVSTYCRKCGKHYKIRHGKAVNVTKTPDIHFLKSDSDADQEETVTDAPTSDQNAAGDTHKDKTQQPKGNSQNDTQETKNPTGELRASITRKVTDASNFFHKKNATKHVLCLECDHQHEAPSDASSTLCPACGAYVSLRNYTINNHWNRRIKTRGNVIIQKKGVVTDVTIYCHDILVQGTLKGGIDCSGDVTLNSASKIMGQLSCKRLIIDKRADVAFANDVKCEEAIIDGHVTGNFICTGKLHLKKRAVLNGNIVVARMTIDKGARHNGRISIQQ